MAPSPLSAGWALLAAVVLIIGFGILYSLLREARPPRGAAAAGAFDPAAVSLAGVQLAQCSAAPCTWPWRGCSGWASAPCCAAPRGGISALFGLLFAVQIAVGFLPGNWSGEVGKFLPATAGQAVTTVHPDPAVSLAPWTGFGMFCLYAAALGLAAPGRRRRAPIRQGARRRCG